MGSFVQALPTIKPMLDNYQSSESSALLPDSTCVQSLLMAWAKNQTWAALRSQNGMSMLKRLTETVLKCVTKAVLASSVLAKRTVKQNNGFSGWMSIRKKRLCLDAIQCGMKRAGWNNPQAVCLSIKTKTSNEWFFT